MPKGNPKPQTIASKKYQEKVGLVNKSYKLRRTLTEQFADACKKRGVSASGAISQFMKEFIAETEKIKEGEI